MNLNEKFISEFKELGVDLEGFYGVQIRNEPLKWAVKWYQEKYFEKNKKQVSATDALDKIADWFYEGTHGKINYEIARNLYKILSDKDNYPSMCRYAIMLDRGEGGTRNPEEAVILYKKLADHGYPWFLYRMAYCYELGRGVEQDTDKVHDLILKSSKSVGCAAFDVARSKYFEDFETLGLDKIIEFYKDAAQKGCSCASGQLKTIEYHHLGSVTRITFKESSFNPSENNKESLIIAAFCFAFGLDSSIDITKSYQAIQAFEQRNMQKSRERFAAEKLKKFILDNKPIYDQFLRLTEEVDIKEADNLKELHNRIESNNKITTIASAVFWVAYAHVCKNSHWVPLKYEARYQAALAETKLIGYTTSDVTKAQSNLGFRFNKLSSSGTLIPYEIDESSIPDDDSSVADFRGVYFRTSKSQVISDISFVGSMDPKYIPLLTQDDLTVALALTYGQDEILNPSLSIENVANTPFEKGCDWLQEKVFNPKWLGATNFGKSLYYADWLMARGFTNTISIKNPYAWTDNQIARLNGSIFDPIVWNHPGEGADSGRMMLFFENVEYSVEERKSWFTKETMWWVNKIDFMIEGSGISYLENGKEDRTVGLNNPHHPDASSGILLTQRLELLYEAYPVFSRVKELFALAKVVHNLKNKGLILNPKLQASVEKSLKKWKEQTAKKPEIILHW